MDNFIADDSIKDKPLLVHNMTNKFFFSQP